MASTFQYQSFKQPSTLPLLCAIPFPTLHYSMSDPDVGTGNFLAKNTLVPGTNDLTSYQTGYGVTGGAQSLLYGLPDYTSTIFSRASGGVAAGGNTLDNTGATPMTIKCIMAPNATRNTNLLTPNQGPYWMDMVSKVSTTSPYPGYRFGCYYSNTAQQVVLYFRLQANNTANSVEVHGTTDMTNFIPRFVVATYDASKSANGVCLYYTDNSGVLRQDITTVYSNTFISTDTATNSGSLSVGGMGGSPGLVLGQYFDGWISSVDVTQKLLQYPQLQALASAAVPAVQQKQYFNGDPQQLIIESDSTTDIDDMLSFLTLTALQKRGEINIACVVITGSAANAAPVIDAMFKSRGLNIPIAAYQGNDRITSASWADAAYAAYGLTKTRANYADPITLLRTTLANAQNASLTYLLLGPMQTTSQLLISPADGISPLTGSQLVAAKCINYVAMCGYLNGGVEYNIQQAVANAAYVFANTPIPIFVSPYENATGTSIAIPGNGNTDIARAAFQGWTGGSSPYYRATSFDVVATYYASRPGNPLITTNGASQTVTGSVGINNGTMTILTGNSYNYWTTTPGKHNALVVPNTSNMLVAMETLVAESVLQIVPGWTP